MNVVKQQQIGFFLSNGCFTTAGDWPDGRKQGSRCRLFLSDILPLLFVVRSWRSRETRDIIRACDSKSLSLVPWFSPVIADVTGCHSLKAAAVDSDSSVNLVVGQCDGRWTWRYSHPFNLTLVSDIWSLKLIISPLESGDVWEEGDGGGWEACTGAHI